MGAPRNVGTSSLAKTNICRGLLGHLFLYARAHTHTHRHTHDRGVHTHSHTQGTAAAAATAADDWANDILRHDDEWENVQRATHTGQPVSFVEK